MPENLSMAVFIFGAVLVLLALLGGGFKLWGAEVQGKAGAPARLFAIILGIGLILVGLLRPMEKGTSPPSNNPSPEIATTNPSPTESAPAEQPAAETLPPKPRQPAMTGDYALRSYTVNGMRIDRQGEMHISRQNDDVYNYEMRLTQADVFGNWYTFVYRGQMVRAFGQWRYEMSFTDDPSAMVFQGGIGLQYSSDGEELIIRTEFGETVVWERE